jgi:tRNA(Arg) A34 adenosine deaminase TadA
MNMPNKKFMRAAIAETKAGIAAGHFPYGAVIVRGKEMIACEHNVVAATTDPTAHAEVHAIRVACARLGTTDLSSCEIYCTCEPCAMCMGACYWAKIPTIYFGASIEDKYAFHLKDFGIGASSLSKQSKESPKVVEGFLRAECVELFALFVKTAKNAEPAADAKPARKRGAPRRR